MEKFLKKIISIKIKLKNYNTIKTNLDKIYSKK